MLEESKAIPVISFDDEKKKYQKWANKFMSAALLRGYNIVLMETNP